MDPALKTWKKELVCDRCKRWASGLTLIKPGVDWNGFAPPAELVDKKICYTCIQKIFKWGPWRPVPYPAQVRLEAILILLAATFFLIAITVRVDPTLTVLLFVGSLGSVAFERWLRQHFRAGVSRKRQKARDDWKAWDAIRRKHSEPLVSIETIFEEEGQELQTEAKF